MFKTCINKGVFPDYWKTSETVLIHKKGDKRLVFNYRPITLLNTTSKVFERLIFEKLYEHVRPHLHASQFGFRPKRSAIVQMLAFLDHVYDKLQDAGELHVAYIDFEKAFDTVCHGRLLEKLWALGFRSKLYKLVQSYLTGRVQRVRVGSSLSDPLPIYSGVPQGSILGPLLFLIYINDLPPHLEQTKPFGFADDYKMISSDCTSLQACLNRLSTWCEENSMKVNSSKCKILNIKGDCEDYIGTERVDTIETQNDLGILINRKFSWSNHAKSRCEKAVRAFFSIKRNTSNSASTYTKLALYCGYIVPILTYGSQAVYLNKGD